MGALLFASSCANYESGYEHGYNDIEARNWIVVGEMAYKEGYEEGRMQAFQDDWYAENADEIVIAQTCPVVPRRPQLAMFTDQNGFIDLNPRN